ncbi:ribosomal protein S20 [Chryseobacterium sp. MDT2-18]|nr:ribosomal protein S20 [Chryseobacterium sp. MDT2-18]
MLTKRLSLFFILIFFFSSAQQNEEFKMVKNYFYYQRSMLNTEFRKRFDNEVTTNDKMAVEKDFHEFMRKLDSLQNNALIHALVKVKIREDLNQLQKQVPSSGNNPEKAKVSSNAAYPGGFNIMRQQIAERFYTNAVLADHKMMRTDLLFVVERDGSITSVKAEGDNSTFNRQAEIALYLLPEKFAPAFINGTAVRYRFRLPLSMNFE